MKYLFTQAIEDCIKECIDTGSGEIKKGKDYVGDPRVWVSAEWVEYDAEHDVIELYIHAVDTGTVFYSTYIMETITKK